MKICARCKTEKGLEDFSKYQQEKNSARCKTCQKELSREHYLKNKHKYSDSRKNRKKRFQDYIDEVKNVPCADCGGSFPPCVMDFDHLDPKRKSFTIAKAGNTKGVTLEVLKEEISKCEVVCSNCHRIRTFKPHRC